MAVAEAVIIARSLFICYCNCRCYFLTNTDKFILKLLQKKRLYSYLIKFKKGTMKIDMIKSFSCRDTKKLFNDQRVRRFQSFERQARKRLMVLHAAPSLQALMLNPGNRFHHLSGDRKGQYSISINKQWRLCFKWLGDNAYSITSKVFVFFARKFKQG